jgi:hypothetical protein
LWVLGAPSSELVRAHFWSAGVPLLLLGWMATAIGWIVCRAIHAFDDRAVVNLEAVAATAAAVLIVGLVMVGVMLPDIFRPSCRSAAVDADNLSPTTVRRSAGTAR